MTYAATDYSISQAQVNAPSIYQSANQSNYLVTSLGQEVSTQTTGQSVNPIIDFGSMTMKHKGTNDDVYASASLANGTLKTRLDLSVGYDQLASNGNIVHNTIGGGAFATIGDTFRAFSDSTPYGWGDSQATFKFDISGLTELNINTSSESPDNYAVNVLSVDIRKVGFHDLLEQYSIADRNNYLNPSSENQQTLDNISQQLNSSYITGRSWRIGDSFGNVEAYGDQLQSNSQLFYSFQPGQDFEWTVRLSSQLQFAPDVENVAVNFDFSHTIGTSFIAPSGADVVSSSGLFPFAGNTSPVPEPETYTMFLAGLGLLGFVARRKNVA